MKTTFMAAVCLLACLCGCAGKGRVPEDRPSLGQRADRLAARVRDQVAQSPARIQGFVETAADSDVVTALLPVIAVTGYLVAFFSGSGCGSGLGSGAATAAP